MGNKLDEVVKYNETDVTEEKRLEKVKNGFFLINLILIVSLLSVALLGYCFKVFDANVTHLSVVMYIVSMLFVMLAQRFLKRFILLLLFLFYVLLSLWDFLNLKFYWSITQGFPLLFAIYYTFINMKNEYMQNKMFKIYFYSLCVISSLACFGLYAYNEYLYCAQSFINYINPLSYIIVFFKTICSPLFFVMATPLFISIGYLEIMQEE